MVALSAKTPLLSLYCAATVYVPACSGLSGRLINALPAELRNTSVRMLEPLGRAMVKVTAPLSDMAGLLVTTVVIVGVPVVTVVSCTTLFGAVAVGSLTSSYSVVALSAKTPLLSLYCAATVYVPACSGLSGRLINALPAELRNTSVLMLEPLGRVMVKVTAPLSDMAGLLVTTAVMVGVPVVRVGFCELRSVVVVGIGRATWLGVV